ncbi:hypothetical protein OBBRIDRAFT_785914 [Obba rivulosa]|uniref:SET domain-containing protein n=1 Tax=Obba rivulosa TaxID=1052685 RepID=A0A8E2AJQ0_9APHY|nr:hypothetical protein OBBRIDRAFT_785914 [Obba rivulosa]
MPPPTARAGASRSKEMDKGRTKGKDKEKDKDKKWKYTKVMNMRDLSRDDDFLSHLLVEKIGTGAVPLIVHKMDPSRRLPKTEAAELMNIVRRLVSCKPNPTAVQAAVRQAVDGLLALNAVSYYLKGCTDKQINAFATHASRYFELYTPTGSIEIAHTSRYSHRTGKSELCILATRPLAPGKIIAELKGSMAHLSEAEDKELKRTDGKYADGVGIRRDFSVIHSKQLKKNHLFLGPARFVNHDCDHNVELFRTGRYITFRVIKPIAVGEELTAHYGDGYFGRKNRHCLCETCERLGRGGYGPDASDDGVSDSGADDSTGIHSEGSEAPSDSDDSDDSDEDEVAVNLNERRTRRGVYAVVSPHKKGSKDADAEREPDAASDLTSLPSSRDSLPLAPAAAKSAGLMTPDPEPRSRGRASSRRSDSSPAPPSHKPSPFRSVIATRAQKAKEAATAPPESASAPPTTRGKAKERAAPARQLVTPPLTADTASASAAPSLRSVRSSSRLRTRVGAASEAGPSRRATPAKDRERRASARASSISTDARREPEPEARTLRPRASVQALADTPAGAKRPSEAPRGVDGKPLPMCATCACVLPVIQIESQVVWGLSLGRTGKRGRPRKNLNVDCPR